MATENIDEIERFADRYALGFERGEGSSHFLRVKIPGGILNTKQLGELAEMAQNYGKGYAEITTRQDLQLHWIEVEKALEVFRDLERIGFTTDKCGQAYPGARYGDVRNIVGCPAAGISREELFDATPILIKVTEVFLGKRTYQDLPRKFKMSISGCPRNCTIPYVQDLAFVGAKYYDGRVGFTILAGGRVGTEPKLAEPLDIFIEADDALEVARSIVELYRDHGPRTQKAKARFKFMLESWGRAKLTAFLKEKLNGRVREFKVESGPIECWEHTGVNRQRQDDKFYVTIPIIGGTLSTATMLRLAEIAERYGRPEVRLTCFQNLMMIDVNECEIPQVKKELKDLGFNLDGYPYRWTTVACAANFCGKGIENTKARTFEIMKHLEAEMGDRLHELNLTISISGCLSGCARHVIADVGLQGVVAHKDGKTIPGYNIYLGGNPSLGQMVEAGVPVERVRDHIVNILSTYLNERVGCESLKDFYLRRSVEEFDKSSGGLR
ncbi:nitrite/sulfite reductase [Candidatus Bathyarchaeota archaeon]|nr:nitrite/sulfite reductase [Candidatus Bathyarchaeota archaeon]MBS7629335.1 nitrite/sulfite reductase [Candidatus Bathyarchaeota archaeon]